MHTFKQIDIISYNFTALPVKSPPKILEHIQQKVQVFV